MTYPPQQPGPYGQQNPWGQQPQGQFPPQPPQSQAPPWLSGDPGGFPSFEPEPKKSRGGLIALIVVLALLVLGGGGVGVWLLMDKDKEEPGGGGGGNGGDDARAVAEKYVEELQATVNTKIEDIELSAMEPVTCADDFERMEKEIGDAQDSGDTAGGQAGSIEIGMKDFESTEEKGSFVLTQTVNGKTGPDQEMSLGKEDGAWKVCGLYAAGSSDPEEPQDPASTEAPADDPTGEAPNSGAVPNPIPTT